MARVNHVKKARKSYPDYGIKKGDSYYWWKFNFGALHKSLTYPKQSRLTNSEFLSNVLEIQERFEGLVDIDEARTIRDDAVSELQDLASEQEEKKGNMPDSLQDSPTGELLQERCDGCNTYADELEGVDLDIEKEDEEDDDEFEERIQEALDSLSELCYEGE